MAASTFGTTPLAVLPTAMQTAAETEYTERLPVGGGAHVPDLDVAGPLCPHVTLPCVYSAAGGGLGSTPATLQALLGSQHTLTTDIITGAALLIGVQNMQVSPTQNAIFYTAEFLLLPT
jgi:hypothetical protein